MMIKLKKIDQLKTKTRRKVAVLLVAYHSVTVIQNETLELSYYVIPKDSKLRKRLLAVISRKDFTSIASHRVCSLHFAGGKKIYLNNVATTVTKTGKTIERTPRRALYSTRVSRRLLPNVKTPDDLTKSIESETECDLTRGHTPTTNQILNTTN